LSVCQIAVKNSKLAVLLQHPVQPAELPSSNPIFRFPSKKSLLAMNTENPPKRCTNASASFL
jgi:hypothetical protein